MGKSAQNESLVFVNEAQVGDAEVTVYEDTVHITNGTEHIQVECGNGRMSAFQVTQEGALGREIRLPEIKFGTARIRLRGRQGFISSSQAKKTLRLGIGNYLDQDTGISRPVAYAHAIDKDRKKQTKKVVL